MTLPCVCVCVCCLLLHSAGVCCVRARAPACACVADNSSPIGIQWMKLQDLAAPFPQDGITEQGLCSPVESLLKWVSVRLYLVHPPTSISTSTTTTTPPPVFFFFLTFSFTFLFFSSSVFPPHPSVCLLFFSLQSEPFYLPLAGFSLCFPCAPHPLTLRDPPSYHSPTCFLSSSHPAPPPLLFPANILGSSSLFFSFLLLFGGKVDMSDGSSMKFEPLP